MDREHGMAFSDGWMDGFFYFFLFSVGWRRVSGWLFFCFYFSWVGIGFQDGFFVFVFFPWDGTCVLFWMGGKKKKKKITTDVKTGPGNGGHRGVRKGKPEERREAELKSSENGKKIPEKKEKRERNETETGRKKSEKKKNGKQDRNRKRKRKRKKKETEKRKPKMKRGNRKRKTPEGGKTLRRVTCGLAGDAGKERQIEREKTNEKKKKRKNEKEEERAVGK